MYFVGAVSEGLLIAHDIQIKNAGSYLQKVHLLNKEQSTTVELHKVIIKNLIIVVRDYLRTVYSDPSLIIKFHSVILPTGSLYGSVVKNGSVVNIYYNKELNHCKQRFAICKELIQAYIDAPTSKPANEYYNPDEIIRQINELFESQQTLMSGADKRPFDTGFESEAIAFISAIELLFPIQDKYLIWFIGHIIESKNGYTNYDLALSYKIPEWAVVFYRKFIQAHSMELLKIK